MLSECQIRIPPMTRSCGRALMARLIRPQVFPLEFPEHPPPQNIRICLLFHSSDILWKKSIQGFSLLHLKECFQSKNPSDGFLACLQDSCSCAGDWLRPPDRRRHRKLKTSLECRGFRRVKIIRIGLIKGFICWANTCCQIFISFIYWYSWSIEKEK